MDAKRMGDRVLNSLLDFWYNPEKRYVRYLLVLVVVGFILRLLAALHMGVLADDMVYASQTSGIRDSKIISTHSNPPLFFYLTDFAFDLFGYSSFSSRLLPLIGGTLLIVVVFLITKRLTDDRSALFAAFLATLANFLVRMTFTEQSLLVFFFLFSGIYAGMIYLDNRKLLWLITSGIFFGLGLLTKYNAPFFIFSFLLYALFYVKMVKKETIFTKRNVCHLIVFLFILILFALPFLSFNYLLYKNKGVVDVYFSRIIHVEKAQELYSQGGLAGQENSFFDNIKKVSNYSNYKLMFKTDLILGLLSIIGLLFFAIKKKWAPLLFTLFFLVPPFILQSAGSPLPKHFVFIFIIASVNGGYALNHLFSYIRARNVKIILIIVLTIILFMGIGKVYATPNSVFSSSPQSLMKSYLLNQATEKDLVVIDPRIYTSQGYWLSIPHHTLSLFQLSELLQFHQNNSNFPTTSTRVFIIECVVEDCGWGTVHTNPQLNATSEQAFNEISKQIQSTKTFDQRSYAGNEIYSAVRIEPYFKVYKTTIPLNQEILDQLDRTQQFYLVPYMYKHMENYLFSYVLRSDSDRLLHKTSYWIIQFSILLSILSFFAVFFSILYATEKTEKILSPML